MSRPVPGPGASGVETLLHVGDPGRGRRWEAILPTLIPDLSVRQWPDMGDPGSVRYLAAWNPPPELFAQLPALEVVFSVGAGVDHLDVDAIPPGIPLVRMIEPGLIAQMVEYAVFAVLALHRDMLDYAEDQRAERWQPRPRRSAASRRIGILGMGTMGGAIAEALTRFGFPVAGWSRSPHQVAGVMARAGKEALPAFLAETDILICTLPLTDATTGVLDAPRLAMLPEGAAVVNIGRGAHLEEAALLAALDRSHLSGAVLDVAGQEPLPAGHPFWRHPRILVTPHVAGTTDPGGGAGAIAANIERHRCGEPMVGIVDLARGY